MLLGSIMGTGVQLVGYWPAGPRRYEVQRWVSVLFVPVVPIDSWIIEPMALDGINLGAVVGQSLRFRIIAPARMSFDRVLTLYALVIAAVVAGVLPFALVVRLFDRPPPIPWPIVGALLLATLWPLAILGWVNHRHERLYEQR